jgi:hypothetical protein
MGNILFSSRDGKRSFYLLDMAEVKLRPSLGLNERWSNLVLLNINFLKDTEDSLRYYFFKHYAEGLVEDRSSYGEIIERIEKESFALASKVCKKKARRCMGSNRLFRTFSYGGLEIHIKRKWDNVPGIETISSAPSLTGDLKSTLSASGITFRASKLCSALRTISSTAGEPEF